MGGEYHPTKCHYTYRLVTSILGMVAGFGAMLSFSVMARFRNYYCSGFALVTGILATICLVLHLKVRRDLTYSLKPRFFITLQVIGTLGLLAGTAVFITALVKGILTKEHGK